MKFAAKIRGSGSGQPPATNPIHAHFPLRPEEVTSALHRNHPELEDVWGDLEKKITVLTPTMAPQPANLKLTLLPFQQESLYWMREQEKGIWRGGVLAVRSFLSDFCLGIDS